METPTFINYYIQDKGARFSPYNCMLCRNIHLICNVVPCSKGGVEFNQFRSDTFMKRNNNLFIVVHIGLLKEDRLLFYASPGTTFVSFLPENT